MSERSGSSHAPTRRVTEPNPLPTRLGVHPSGDGLDVAVIARGASSVDMCIFDEAGAETRFALLGPKTGVWHGHIPGYGAGTRYGFRAHGTWDPDGGKFFNSRKLLLDPYGRGVDGVVDLKPAVYAHYVDDELYPSEYPMRRSPLDSAPHMPRSVVVESSFPIIPQPRTPWENTVIYEIHVKGFTKNMPGVPQPLRGTYAGLAHPASVSYLKDLGITAVELLPIHAKCDEPFLTERGLTNYWGYSTLSFFAPEPSYATAESRARGAQAVVDEFRGMVSLLHQAGIEVILDVVYNHTCEGGDAGPSLSWRGLDSDMYYRHTTSRPIQTIDVTGTGNTMNMDHPKTIQMVLDSLRYWVRDMGVDGFRFDLAATLGRFSTGFSPMHPLLIAMATDDILTHTKLIAEPWDVGPGGWQTGNFPVPFSEWNDHYRGALRNFWLADVRAQASGHIVSGPNDPPVRLPGRLRARPRSAAWTSRVDQFRDRSRRLHARRPDGLRPQAQQGQSRKQPRRLRRQPLVEPRPRRNARVGRDPPGRRHPLRDPRQHADRAPACPLAAQHPGNHVRLLGHTDAHGRRRVRAHAKR